MTPRTLVLLLLVAAACGGAPRGAVRPRVPASLAPGAIVEATPESFRATLRSLRGRPLVVNFWASWCTPCVAEMPRLVDAAKRYEGRVGFLGVNVEDAEDDARNFARKAGLTFPSLADPKGDILRMEKVVGLPATQFYRPDGELAFRHTGEIKTDQLETKLVELMRIGTTRDGR